MSWTPEATRERILRDFRTVWAQRARRGPYQHRLSSAGKCVRALTYHRRGIPESNPAPARAGLRLELGTLIHRYLDQKLRDLAYPLREFEHEVALRTPGGLVVTGHFDRAIGDSVILDYKSASDASFRYMADLNAPLPEYVAQFVGYLEACRQSPSETLRRYTHVLCVVVNKDSRERDDDGIDLFIPPPVTHDPELAAQIAAKFDEVERHAQAGTLPPRPYGSPADYPCRFCSWRDLCWGATLPQAPAAGAADLSHLAAVARAYADLSARAKDLDRERERLAGQLRAALADAGTRRGIAGEHEVRLVTQARATLNPDLVPPDIRERATVVTEVTQLRVIPIPGGPAPQGSPAEPAAAPVPGDAPAPAQEARDADATPEPEPPSSPAAGFLQTPDGRFMAVADFLAFVGRAARAEFPTAPDPIPMWLARHRIPADPSTLTPDAVGRACRIAARILRAAEP